jgi:hypothetical protein
MVALHRRVPGSRNPIRTVGVVACMAVAASLISACSTENGSETAATEAATTMAGLDVAALHAIPADSVAVSGTATCDFNLAEGVDPTTAEGPGLLVTCQLDMSDPRVSGTEIHDRFRFYKGEGDKFQVWVAESSVLTNSEGTWRGVSQAVEDATVGYAIGEARYVGEGDYDGLAFHYYFDDQTNGEVVVKGWISSAA